MPKDDREIRSHIRMPTTGEGGKRLQKGEVISDPDELAKLAGEGKVDLQALYNSGAITGTWKGVKAKK